MTPEEYKQLKAFARQDGALLSLFWIGALICYVQGMTNPLLGLVSLILIIASPFFAASRLRHFRDYAREGVISFKRGYAYLVLTFFYAGLLLAAAMYIYFAFIDKGFLYMKLSEMMSSEEGRLAIQAAGMKEQMEEGLKELSNMRPIDYALNMLTFNIMTGFFLGLPIAALMQRQVAVKSDK
jgi:hypothetical protein